MFKQSLCFVFVFIHSVFISMMLTLESRAQPAVTLDSLNATITAGLTVTISGDFVNQSAGSIANAGVVEVTGNWTNNADNGLFSIRQGTLKLIGDTQQVIGGVTATALYNLEVANTSVILPQITMESGHTVTNLLTLTQGLVSLAGDTLTLGTSDTTTGYLSHTNGWLIDGTFSRWYSTATVDSAGSAGLFPMGSLVDFRPIKVAAPADPPVVSGYISASHSSSDSITNIFYNDIDLLLDKRFDSYWSLDPGTVSGGTFCVIASGSGFSGITDIQTLRLMQAGSAVAVYGTNGGNTLFPEVVRWGLVSTELLNNFYFGYSTDVLPVEMISMEARFNMGAVDISWETASEWNNDYFGIEHSTDRSNFLVIAKQAGAGNSVQLKRYFASHENPPLGWNYYRLYQVDFDGKVKRFAPMAVEVKSEKTDFVGLESTQREGIALRFNRGSAGPVHISLYDLQGRLLTESTYPILRANHLLDVAIETLRSGIYLVTVSDNVNFFSSKFFR